MIKIRGSKKKVKPYKTIGAARARTSKISAHCHIEEWHERNGYVVVVSNNTKLGKRTIFYGTEGTWETVFDERKS